MKRFQVSKIQKQFWILNGMNPDSGAYNLFSVFKVGKPLDHENLEEAVRYVIDRHEPLRTSFDFVDDELFQVIRTSSETEFSICTFNIDQPFDDEKIHPAVIAEANKPFDLSNAPLCRVSLFTFANRVSVLTIVFHHIIVDVRSEGVFAKEMSARYNYLAGKNKDLPQNVPYQYSDYISEINTWYESDAFSRKLEDMAADYPNPGSRIHLPEDSIETKADDSHGSEVFFSIDEKLTTRVKEFSESHNINPYRFFLSAYAVFLHRLSRQEQIYIGLPLTNRTRPVSKTTFGCFINALPMLVDFSDDKELIEIVNSVKGALSDMLDRQEVPFTDLVAFTREDNTTTVNPYFQTGYAFKPPMQLELDGIETQILKVEKTDHQTEFDFLLTFYPEKDTFTGYVTYSKQLFKRDTIKKWIKTFRQVVVQIIENSGLPVGKVSILTEEDKTRLKEFNNTSFPLSGMLIHELIEKQAELTPGKVAVISGDSQLTYRELDNQSSQMANYIIEKGAKQGDSVGICLERSVEMVVSILGVLKAGCTYIPMDPSFPDERIKYMFDDSGASVFITQSSLVNRFKGFKKATLVLTDGNWSEIVIKSTDKPTITADQLSIAYMIYTSGSTGKPKGVEVYHRGVVNLVESMSKVPGIRENDILLAVVTLSFDMSVYELYVPLSNGATVVVASSNDTTDGQALINLIEKHNITMLQATPSLWNILLGSGWKGKKDLRAFCGGEALTKNMVRQALPRVSEFWNCYGPTETTVYSACMQVTDPEAPIMIGRPIGNTRIHILDNQNYHLPVGMTGEVCIGGLGVTKGYCHLPELTKEKFILLEDGELVYKTGDLGRFLPDGNIELFGRIDNQIKLRGFRIEPGEIESLLSRIKGVKEAVVKIHKFEETDERLVAFLNAGSSFSLSDDEMTSILSQHLPSYMIPSFYQVSDGFPRLPNGKINKNALLFTIDKTKKNEVVEFENLTTTQKKLFAIWEDILKTGSINPSSSFFNIGGNSLLTISVLNKVKEDMGFVMSFKDFMSHPTIIKAGNFIDSKTGRVGARVDLKHISSTKNLPLTVNQKRLWLISKLQPDIPTYIIPFTYKLTGTLDTEVLRRSLVRLFNRHDIIYSVIKEADGEPYCDIVPSEVNISFYDFTTLPDIEKANRAEEVFFKDSKTVFDLENGPLYRIYLIKTRADEYYFRISIHHIIFDGWSWSILAKDLNIIYNSLLIGEEPELETLVYQQYDYAFWEKETEGHIDDAKSVKYWKKNLAESSPAINFPYDYKRTEESSGSGMGLPVLIPEALTEKLRNISRKEDVSLFATMLAAYGLHLQRYSGEEDINVGLPVAYRPHSELEKIFGMFVNTVVLRLKGEKGLTFRDIIQRSNEVALNAIAHQNVPFEKVVEIVKPERYTNANPLFQIAFAWQNNLDEPIDFDGTISEKVTAREKTSIFDLTLALWENGQNIEGEIEFNLDLIKVDTIERFRDNLVALLEYLVENPDGDISEISVITEADRKLLETINNTSVPVPDIFIPDIFGKWADKNPDKTAVISGDKKLTYSGLDQFSNQIARYLKKTGVRDGAIVAVCLDKSVELVASFLGVLKSGCSYLPIDPVLPDERIQYMCEDSDSEVVITKLSLKDKFNSISDDKLIILEDSINEINAISKEKTNTEIDGQSIAYVIYTSGSTGKPKGVKLHHHASANWIQSQIKAWRISETENILGVASQSFDMSVAEFLISICSGTTLILPGLHEIKDGNAIINIIEKYDITEITATPSLWSMIIDSGWSGKSNLKIVTGGEALTMNLMRKLLPRVKELYNYYGPTETTMCSTGTQITGNEEVITIGKPIENTKIYILNKYDKILPVGVIGELAIGGFGVSKGYINRPELNAEKFIKFRNEGIFYKTGDTVRLLPDGNIEFYGRKDNQIKLRGYRIEPGEIENQLTKLDGVRESVVKVNKFGANDDRLVAFLNVEPQFDMSRDLIMEHLSQSLPSYMIPSYFQVSESFPRLSNGKINKNALIFSIEDTGASEEIELDQLTTTQRKLYIMWEEVLKIKNINPALSFFDIGGNSLLSIRIINKVKEQLGLNLSFKVFLANPSVFQLSNYIDNQSDSAEKVVSLVHLTETSHLPLSLNQKRLWLISKLQPDTPSYIIPVTYKFTGDLNIEIFRESINRLFNRHHVVFSIIKEDNGEPYCNIVPSDVMIKVLDYSGLSEKEKSENIESLINTDSRKIFNLEKGPLYRLYLIRSAENEYYFRMSIHHIIFDGWSWSVFAKELNNIYNGLLKGQDPELEVIEFQQYDFADWEKNYEGSKTEADSIEFWKKNLVGGSTVLNFPFDFQRTDESSGKGLCETLQLTKDMSEKLRDISDFENISLFTTLLSIYGIQMHIYSGEDDINIGLPIAYRPHSKLENIFGMFVNTVVVRLKYEKNMTFRDLIRMTNEASLNAIAHQDLPFEKVVEIVNPDRSSNANPLFQVGFIWQNNLDVPLQLHGIKCEKVTGKERTSVFDITLSMWENGNYIEGEVEYDTDLLKNDTIDRLIDNFRYLVHELVENPDKPVSEMKYVSAHGLAMIDSFNNTGSEVPDLRIHELFTQRAGEDPGRAALVSGEQVISYGELDRRSNRIANHLIRTGAKAGDIVGLCLERTEEMVISVLGILKAGCAYLPMDPSFPDERIKYMYEDSGAGVLISQSSLKEKFSGFNDTSVILVDSDSTAIGESSPDNPGVRISPDNLAYMIYTSGSTGKPKGVKVHHGSVVNFLGSMKHTPGFGKDDRLLAVTTLSFDISVLEIFLPLTTGGEVVIATSGDISDGQVLSGLLDKHDITVMQATPATWNILLGSDWSGKKDLKALCGGEAILPGLVKELLPKVSSLWNMYGPTETTVWSTCMELTDPTPPILVGKPIDNTDIYILDRNHNQLPVGVTGEVCIGGQGVTKGYNNRPELTSEKFITWENGRIIYKTGDFGRYLPDGNIELFGRIDNQIKLRGFRIEPGEIENLLSRIPGIREAVVKVQKFGDSDDRLVAFLNAEQSFNIVSEEISSALSKDLPGYMIPSYYQVSDGFPRLPNGKINKKALVFKLEETETATETDFESLTDTQKKIYRIWESVLKTGKLPINVNFFDAGGNSLLAIRILNKIKEEIGYTMSFKSFIAFPTIIQAAGFIDSQYTKEADVPQLIHINQTKNLPLSFNQRRLWLISKLQPDVASYIIPYNYKLTGAIDVELFRKSIEILFYRHHVVFSVFKESNGEPYCDIVPSPVNLNYLDLTDIPDNEITGRVNAIFNEDSKQVFDLENGPMFRIYLIKTGDQQYYFRMSIHHIVFDGWSWSVFTKELNIIYSSLVNNEEIQLEDIEFQQYDYAKWEKGISGSQHELESAKFWQENLEGASSVLNFPYDFERKTRSSGRCNYEKLKLTTRLTEKLRNISRTEDISVFATVLGAFGIQLQKYSGENDINVGLPVAYRPHSKLENIFGMFVNTVVVRFRLSEDSTFRTVIHDTSEAALNAIAHQDLPFEKVVELVNPDRSSKANPLFQVGFTWQNNIDAPFSLEGIKSESVNSSDGTSIFDISFYMWENGDHIEGNMEYNIDLLTHETMIRFRDSFINMLETVTEEPDRLISEVSIISEADKNIVMEFNDTDAPYENSICIHHKFERQVSLNPDAPALISAGQTLSYTEFNEHANRLAHYLIEQGVSVEDKVGICVDRSVEMMIAIFGILKSGAAYLPLSPENPTERLQSILNDANPRMILTGKDSSANLPEGVKRVFIDDVLNSPFTDDISNPDVQMDSKNLAYVLYTSGSTGTPKGVMIEHHSVLNRLGWMQKAYPLDNNDTLLQKTPITFDVSVWELFWWSFNGARLAVLSKGGEKDPEAIIQYIESYKVTAIHFVPSMFATFFETMVTRNLSDKLETLRRIFLSGEALPLKLVNDFNKLRGAYKLPQLINLYGPTEATVDVSYYNCPLESAENVYIGKPIDNTRLYVVNGKNILQPLGVPGELLIAGVNLARGYLNRPELTNEKFFDFTGPDGKIVKAYHSGDMVRLSPIGQIDYIGRIDNQIKIRGFRIELGDIEAKILEHPLVTHCAVIVTQKGEYKYLVAYVCPKPGADIQTDTLKSFLSGKLPDYMVPAYIMFIDEIPLTSSGKLNRKSLPSPDSLIERKTVVSPTNINERKLFDIWSSLLKSDNISINDNFFDIGGNSLLAINLVNMISREFDTTLKALMIFEYPSIKVQSEYLSGNGGENVSQKNIEIDEKTRSKKNVNFKRVR